MVDRLREALGLKGGGVVSLVGAGGKTSLMFRLAAELAGGGRSVLTTTTTRICVPTAAQSAGLILAPAAEQILEQAVQALHMHRHITVAAGRAGGAEGKLAGLKPEAIDRLRASGCFDWIIVEADGAAGRPLKAPADHEPVIPACTGWLVGTVGLTAVGRPLTEEWVFRPELFARITGLAPGAAVTEEAVAAVLGHAQGILKGAPDGCRRLSFLNQADSAGGIERGRRIGDLLAQHGASRIERVIVGQALGEPPVSALIDLPRW